MLLRKCRCKSGSKVRGPGRSPCVAIAPWCIVDGGAVWWEGQQKGKEGCWGLGEEARGELYIRTCWSFSVSLHPAATPAQQLEPAYLYPHRCPGRSRAREEVGGAPFLEIRAQIFTDCLSVLCLSSCVCKTFANLHDRKINPLETDKHSIFIKQNKNQQFALPCYATTHMYYKYPHHFPAARGLLRRHISSHFQRHALATRKDPRMQRTCCLDPSLRVVPSR